MSQSRDTSRTAKHIVDSYCPFPKEFRDDEKLVIAVQKILDDFDWKTYRELKDKATPLQNEYQATQAHHHFMADRIGGKLQELFQVWYKRAYQEQNYRETIVISIDSDLRR